MYANKNIPIAVSFEEIGLVKLSSSIAANRSEVKIFLQ